MIEDYYTRRASERFGVPLDEVTSEMRRKTKLQCFGKMYGGAKIEAGLKVTDADLATIQRDQNNMDLHKVEAQMMHAAAEERSPGPRKVVILDRDGVINVDHGYVTTVARVDFIPHALDALRQLHEEDFVVLVASNQSAIDRGMANEKQVLDVMEFIRQAVRATGGFIADVAICPHGPDDLCECRKPKPYMLFKLAEKHHFQLNDAWMIGDGLRDVEAGNRAGCHTILLCMGERPVPEGTIQTPLMICPDLWNAAQHIIREMNGA